MADEEEEKQYEVEKILRHRERRGVKQYFVRWLGYPDEDNSWVDEDDMACPELICSYLAKYEDRRNRDRLRKSHTPSVRSRQSSNASSTYSKKQTEPKAPPPKKHKIRKISTSSSSASPPPHRSNTLQAKEQDEPQRTRATSPPSPPRSSGRGSSVASDVPTERNRSKLPKPVAPAVADEPDPINSSSLWSSIADLASKVTSPAVDRKKKKKSERLSHVTHDRQTESSKKKAEKAAASEPRKAVSNQVVDKKTEEIPSAKEQTTVSQVATEEGPKEESDFVIPDQDMDVPQPPAELPKAMEMREEAVASADKAAVTVEAVNNDSAVAPRDATVAPVAKRMDKAVASTEDSAVASDDVLVSASVRRRMLQKARYAAKFVAKEGNAVAQAAADKDQERPSSSSDAPCPPLSPSNWPKLKEKENIFEATKYDGEESEQEAHEGNDDDLSYIEEVFGKEGDETVPLRQNSSKNPYDRGLKAHKIVGFTRFRGKYYAAIKFHGHDILENIEYYMVRRLDPVLLANYYVKIHKRCLARGIDMNRPGGFMELLSDEESDDDF